MSFMSNDPVFGHETIFGQSQAMQTPFEESSTQKHGIGQKLVVRRNNHTFVYRYCKVGASGVSRGQLMQMPASVANHTNIAVGGAVAAGNRVFDISTTLSTTLSANQYDDGFFHINDADVEGSYYQIKKHTATTTPEITLYDPLDEALVTTSEFSLTPNPWRDIIVLPTTTTGMVVGIPRIDLTASYYAWLQTAGPCACLVDGSETLVAGDPVGVPHTAATAGTCGLVLTFTLTEGTPNVINALTFKKALGTVLKANAATEYALINLEIDTAA